MQETPIDYRRLLKKYMEMIGYLEGVYFLGPTADPSDPDDVELHKIADEIREEKGKGQ